MMQKARVQFGTIAAAAGHRILIYGPGGIGKTTLCSKLPGKTAYYDIDESLPRLRSQLDTGNLFPVTASSWSDVRATTQQDGWDEINNIVYDSGSMLEQWAVAHTLATVKTDKDKYPASVEGYGYGKGFQFVYDTFIPLMGDLDRHARAGRNVIIVCHDCTHNVPNPNGEDWLRWEPRLQDPASGKASIRLRLKEWVDHCLFLAWDIDVNKDGKGKGCDSRTVYTKETPFCMAKSRTTQDTIPLGDPADFWPLILK
jgi:hypothetical protein